jgi:hypothetical protein
LPVKGFVPDDERIKAGRTIGQDCFDELLTQMVWPSMPGRVSDPRASKA